MLAVSSEQDMTHRNRSKLKMNSNLDKLVLLWAERVSPSITLLTVTVGMVGLLVCTLLLWALEFLFTQVFPLTIYTVEVETLQRFHQAASPGLDTLMLTITRLGNPETVVPVGLVLLGTLIVHKARSEAWIVAATGMGAILLNTALKPLFGRHRPDLYPQLIHDKSFSFPSGHSLGTTVLYGMIAYLLARQYPQFALWIYLLAIILAIAVGCSRLYLDLHWPTDVLAGWSIGLLWLMTGITMLRLQRFRKRQHWTG